MLPEKAGWNIGTVMAVHVLRIVTGLLLAQTVYPFWSGVSAFWIELVDRITVLFLVWLVLVKSGVAWTEIGLSLNHAGRNGLWGLLAGVGLLTISIYSEKYYAAWLLLTPAQHPLAVQAQAAASWQQLLSPLFLAGVAAPVAEEALYRLLTFLPLRERWGVWGGTIGSAAIFTLMHFSVYWLGEMMVIGIGLALLYYWTGSLVSAIVAHSFVNASKILLLFFGVLPVT